MTEEPVGGDEAQLALDQLPLPTLAMTVRAGDPYSPFTDDKPLVIAGQPACLVEPTVALTPGATEVSASIVGSRRDLMNRLDLGVEGVPVNVGALAGVTGTARLAIDTELDERSLNLMFQAKGTYESTLTGVGAAPATFDPSRVGSCGWGYVNKSYHRLSAIVMVTIQSSDGTSRVRLGCGKDEESCAPTSIGTGTTKAKLALETMLKGGSFEIRVRSVADVIPGLEPTPLGDIVAMSSTPDTAADVVAKLDRALAWLGSAQAQIASRIDTIRSNPTTGPAPTVKVAFTYWPGIDPALRERAGRTYEEIVALRKDHDVTLQRLGSWQAFEDERALGFGHLYQLPAAPLPSVEAVTARGEEARGELDARRREIETRLGACDAAAHNDSTATDAAALVAGLEVACHRHPAASWESTYDTRYGVRRLAPLGVVRRTYDEWTDNMCPPGQRLPNVEEAALLAPWSNVDALWLRRASWIAQPRYVSAGKVVDVGLFAAPEQFAACFDASARSLFD